MIFEPGENAEKLIFLADSELDKLNLVLPSDEPRLKLMLLQLVQSLDYLLLSPDQQEGDKIHLGQKRVLLSGWNLLFSKIIKSYSHGGIYLQEFTPNVFRFITTLIHLHGRVSVLKSVADTIRHGSCELTIVEDTWHISRVGNINDPYLLDINEFIKSDLLKNFVDSSNATSVFGWTVVDKMDETNMRILGRFQQRREEFSGQHLYRSDLDERIAALVRPFNTGNGIITQYEASPETDYHFIAAATELSLKWRDEAGLHPDVVIGRYKISEISTVIILVVSLHLKHIQFCSVAASIYPEISFPQSLTIWTKFSELVDSITALSDVDLDLEHIKGILELIIFTEKDSDNLKEYPRLFIPLLINMGDDMLLRPASSICVNPFETIKALLHWRVPNARNLLAAPREAWLRNDIYAMFNGTRYICVPSNIKLRSGGKILTDVDGAIFDKTTGELGLFQLKCQDYSSATTKELRSRAKNLSHEMDSWCEAVFSWIKISSVMDVIKAFQIPIYFNFPNRIYLFGVSRHIARTEGYGAIAKHGAIALCNFAQFCIARTEIGPNATVLGAMHERLFAEMENSAAYTPISTEFLVCGKIKINLADFFYDLAKPEPEAQSDLDVRAEII